MGWLTDDGLHEGYLVPEFADGVRGAGISGAGISGAGISGGGVADDQVIVGIGYAATGGPDVHLTRPAAAVIGWRIACDCRSPLTANGYGGDLLPEDRRWVSDLIVRVPSRALEEVTAGRIYAADADVLDVVELYDEQLHAWWRREHADGTVALARIRAARAQIAAAERELDAAGEAARQAGETWEAIGAAAGMTRQSAHSRWK